MAKKTKKANDVNEVNCSEVMNQQVNEAVASWVEDDFISEMPLEEVEVLNDSAPVHEDVEVLNDDAPVQVVDNNNELAFQLEVLSKRLEALERENTELKQNTAKPLTVAQALEVAKRLKTLTAAKFKFEETLGKISECKKKLDNSDELFEQEKMKIVLIEVPSYRDEVIFSISHTFIIADFIDFVNDRINKKLVVITEEISMLEKL